MADELFFQAAAQSSVRRFERRLGLSTSDARKSCGTRFLSNLESAIFSRAGALAGDVSGMPFPRRDSVRG